VRPGGFEPHTGGLEPPSARQTELSSERLFDYCSTKIYQSFLFSKSIYKKDE